MSLAPRSCLAAYKICGVHSHILSLQSLPRYSRRLESVLTSKHMRWPYTVIHWLLGAIWQLSSVRSLHNDWELLLNHSCMCHVVARMRSLIDWRHRYVCALWWRFTVCLNYSNYSTYFRQLRGIYTDAFVRVTCLVLTSRHSRNS